MGISKRKKRREEINDKRLKVFKKLHTKKNLNPTIAIDEKNLSLTVFPVYWDYKKYDLNKGNGYLPKRIDSEWAKLSKMAFDLFEKKTKKVFQPLEKKRTVLTEMYGAAEEWIRAEYFYTRDKNFELDGITHTYLKKTEEYVYDIIWVLANDSVTKVSNVRRYPAVLTFPGESPEFNIEFRDEKMLSKFKTCLRKAAKKMGYKVKSVESSEEFRSSRRLDEFERSVTMSATL